VVTFKAKLSAAVASNVVLGWSTGDDDTPGANQATAGTDYTAVTAGSVTITASQTEASFSVTTTGDTTTEGDETFAVTITGTTVPAGVAIGARTAVGTIVDDDLNGAPTAGALRLSTVKDQPLRLTAEDFTGVFSDPDSGDSMKQVKVMSVPAAGGTLTLDGNAVSGGDEIASADLGAMRLTFTPAADYVGDATFEFQLSDQSDAYSAIATATITVAAGAPPPANHAPGFDEGSSTSRSVAENSAAGTPIGSPVTASDPDGDPLTYGFDGVEADSFTIDGATGQITVASGTALDYEAAPSHRVRVTVTDGTTSVGIDVIIHVIDVDPPTRAPGDLTVTGATPTTLTLSWSWPYTDQPPVTGYRVRIRVPNAHSSDSPPAPDASIVETTEQFVTISGLTPAAEYLIDVQAYTPEGQGPWSESVLATTEPVPGNRAPVADAGPDQTVADGATVTLDGSGSTDPDGDALTHAWTQRSGPPVTLSDPTAARTTFTAPSAPAVLEFALRVADGAGGRDTDTVRVHVRAAAALRMERVNDALLPELTRALADGTRLAVRAGMESATPAGAAGHLPTPFGGRPGVYAIEDALRSVVDGATFAVPLSIAAADDARADADNGAAGGPSQTTLAAWGSSDFRSVSGRPEAGEEGVRWSGDLFMAHTGLSVRPSQDLVVGLALSWADGAFTYTDTTGGTSMDGTYVGRLLGAHPYLRYGSSDLKLWGVAGASWGAVEIKDADAEPSRSALRHLMLAGGGSDTLATAELIPGGETSVAVKAEALAAAANHAGNKLVDPLAVHVVTLRVLLEGSHDQALGDGGRLHQSVELGLRRDSGDGLTGGGVEGGGALRYRYQPLGLSLEIRGRALVAHHVADLRDWGIGGVIRLAPGGGGHGLSLQVQPEWGRTGSGVQQVWAGALPADAEAGGSTADGRMAVEISYGVPVFGEQGVLTPIASATVEGDEVSSYRLGTRFVRGGLTVSLTGERRIGPADAPPVLTLEGSIGL
ncbi:MAG: fibronectin type III domain-containing protein, partial [Spirochaetaceae bacterium]|nr:fibronectin type III domain-containing protein [Spirochaetaceae bacterium]